MHKLTLEEYLAQWGITGRLVKVVTDHSDEGFPPTRNGTFELMLDGAIYKGAASWRVLAVEPSIPELVNDLRSMALACDNAADFEAWAKDLGYDTDSRAAENSYFARCNETRKLERWLGLGRFRQLLWETKGICS